MSVSVSQLLFVPLISSSMMASFVAVLCAMVEWLLGLCWWCAKKGIGSVGRICVGSDLKKGTRENISLGVVGVYIFKFVINDFVINFKQLRYQNQRLINM